MSKRSYRPHLEVLVSHAGSDAPQESWQRYIFYHIADPRKAWRNDQWVHEILNSFRAAVESYDADVWIRVDYLEAEEYGVMMDGVRDVRTRWVNRRTVIGPVRGQSSTDLPTHTAANGEDWQTIEMRFPRTDQFPRTENPDWPLLEVGGTSSGRNEEAPAVEGLAVTEDGEIKLEENAERIELGQTITVYDEFGHPQELTIQ